MQDVENSRLKKQFKLIEEIVSNDIYNLGEQFFDAIATKLNEVLGADYTFIGKLTENKDKIETISLVNKTGQIDNIIYDLKHTPCENVVGQNPCLYPKNVTSLFPQDQLLIDMGIEAYVGVPLYDSKMEATGILVCLYENEIRETFSIESILMIFASRASAELEHMKLYAELDKYKQALERKVDERTKELNKKNTELELANKKLSKTLANLQTTQSQLIQSEKMASLGILTSGVAHEINNPLNYLMGSYVGLSNYFDKFDSYDKTNTDILLDSINVGVNRISSIVKGLNQFSRNNESMDEDCDIHEILNNCFTIVRSQSKHKTEFIKNYSNEQIIARGNAGKIHQVFLNILTNSIHALKDEGEVSATTHIRGENALIEILDNGRGIDKSIINKILDPFFTTKPPGEGTGLGLPISLSIIEEHRGTFNIESELNKGTKITITLPLKKLHHG